MPYEIVCGGCGVKMYSGMELRSPMQILRLYNFTCKKCGRKLTDEHPDIEVIEIGLATEGSEKA